MVFIGIYPGLLFSGMIHQQILQFGVLCELKAVLNVFLPARRRPSGLVVSGVCLCVCVCVRAHCFCPQDISRTGSWITT